MTTTEYATKSEAIRAAVVPAHPAPFPPRIVELIREAIWPDLVPARKRNLRVLDPFAGVGGIHALRETPTINGRGIETFGVELMPRWAAASPYTQVGDATRLTYSRGAFDAVATSPTYANRMGDHHAASDACKTCDGKGWVCGVPDELHNGPRCDHDPTRCPTCKGTKLSHRRSYAHYYGRDAMYADADPSVNTCLMGWRGSEGEQYRDVSRAALDEIERVLRIGGRFVLNVKDHVRDGKRQRVARWWHDQVLRRSFVELWRWDVPVDGYGMGANRDARIRTEQVYVFERVPR